VELEIDEGFGCNHALKLSDLFVEKIDEIFVGLTDNFSHDVE
jgi:hypothetical protein